LITQWVFLLVERSVPAELYRLYEERQFCDHCYNLNPLTLSPLGTLPIQQLAHELGTKRGQAMVLTAQNADEVCAIGEGLPLYSILALDNLLQHGELGVSSRVDLVRKQALRKRAEFRQHGLDEQYWPLLALATLTQGLPWQDAERFLGSTKCPEKRVLDRVFQEDTASAIPAMNQSLQEKFPATDIFSHIEIADGLLDPT